MSSILMYRQYLYIILWRSLGAYSLDWKDTKSREFLSTEILRPTESLPKMDKTN